MKTGKGGKGMSQYRGSHHQGKGETMKIQAGQGEKDREKPFRHVKEQTDQPHDRPHQLKNVGGSRIVVVAVLHDVHFGEKTGKESAVKNAAREKPGNNIKQENPDHMASFTAPPTAGRDRKSGLRHGDWYGFAGHGAFGQEPGGR